MSSIETFYDDAAEQAFINAQTAEEMRAARSQKLLRLRAAASNVAETLSDKPVVQLIKPVEEEVAA